MLLKVPLLLLGALATPGTSAPLQGRRTYENPQGAMVAVEWTAESPEGLLLELDVQHGHDVVHCTNTHLHLEVPQWNTQWKFVTASSHRHNCHARASQHLYRRIKKVAKVAPIERGHRVVLETEELDSPQQIFPSLRVRVVSTSKTSKERAWLELSNNSVPFRSLEEYRQEEEARRLSFLKFLGHRKLPKFMHMTGEEPQVITDKFREAPENEAKGNSLIDFDYPVQTSQLHFDYDFKGNTKENPQFMYKWEGGRGYVRLFHPYVDADVNFDMNISSKMDDVFAPPKVWIDGVLNGIADIDLDMALAGDYERDSSDEVMDTFLRFAHLNKNNIPFLKGFKTDQGDIERNLHPITFHVGGTPWTIIPGFKTTAEFYHIGFAKGSMRTRLKGKLLLDGNLYASSEDFTMHVNMKAKMVNVQFAPPSWILQTRHFESGLELVPKFYVRGCFGAHKHVEYSLGISPYFNLTLDEDKDEEKDLTKRKRFAVLPLLAFGLPVDLPYEIRISTNDQASRTGTQINTGIMKFTGNLEDFDFGEISEQKLEKEEISVEILEFGQEVVGIGKTVCKITPDGLCTKESMVVHIKITGQEKEATVYLKGAWKNDATGVLELNMHDLSVRFPMTSLTKMDIVGALSDDTVLRQCEVHFSRLGRKYVIPLRRQLQMSSQLLASQVVWNLGLDDLATWAGSDDFKTSNDLVPKLEFVLEGKVIAWGVFPQIDFDTVKKIESLDDLQEAESLDLRVYPITVGLYDPKIPEIQVGSVQAEVRVGPPELQAFFAEPWEATTFKPNKVYKFSWATHHAAPGDTVKFEFTAMEVSEEGLFIPTRWLQPFSLCCERYDDEVKVKQWTKGKRRCLFRGEASLPDFLADKTIVLMTSWLDDDGNPEFMVSEPMYVSEDEEKHIVKRDGGTQRRLGSFHYHGHKQGEEIRSQAELEDMRKHCGNKVLRYCFGAGINFVQHMDNVMPSMGGQLLGDPNMMSGISSLMGSMGGLGDMLNNPEFKLPPVPLWVIGENGETFGLSKFFPSLKCYDGLCTGTLSACSEMRIDAIKMPKVDFELNRDFCLGQHLGPRLRDVIAYGLSVLPEAVALEEKFIRKNHSSGSGHKYGEDVYEWRSSSERFDLGGTKDADKKDDLDGELKAQHDISHGSASSTTTVPPPITTTRTETAAPVTTVTKTEPPTTPSSTTEKGHRRLSFAEDTSSSKVDKDLLRMNGEDTEFPGDPPFRRFRVRIKDLPFELTDERLADLIAFGAFRSLEDGQEKELGPITIVAAKMRRDPPAPALQAKLLPGHKDLAASLSWLPWAISGIAGCATVATFLAVRKLVSPGAVATPDGVALLADDA